MGSRMQFGGDGAWGSAEVTSWGHWVQPPEGLGLLLELSELAQAVGPSQLGFGAGWPELGLWEGGNMGAPCSPQPLSCAASCM